MKADNRPLAVFGVFFLGWQFASHYLPPAAYWLSAAVLLLCLAAAVIIKRNNIQKSILLCLLAFCAAGLNLFAFDFALEKQTICYANGVYNVTACAEEQRLSDSENEKTILKITEIDGEKVKPFRVYAYGLSGLETGDVIKARLMLKEIEDIRLKSIYYPDKIIFSAQKKGEISYLYTENSPAAFFAAAKNKFNETLKQLYSGDIFAVQAAVCTGERGYITPALASNFRAAGISHMLCVSGLHLSVIALSVYYLLKRLLNYKIASVAAIALTVFYTAFIGFTPSIMRASIMLCVALAAGLLARGYDFFTSLLLSALLLTANNPYMVLNAGFLLSFFATAGVYFSATAVKSIRKSGLKKPLKALCVQAAVPLCAMLATLPVQAYIGGTVSVIGIAVNVACVWLLSPMLILSYLSAALYNVQILRFASRILAAAVKAVCGIILFVADTAAGLSGGAFNINGAFAAVSAVLALLCGALLWKKGLVRRAAVVTFAVLFAAVGIFSALNFNTVRIAAVGTGNYVSLAVSSGGRAAVILCGGVGNAEKLARYTEKNNLSVTAVYNVDTQLSEDTLNGAFLCENIINLSCADKGIYSRETLFDGIILEIVFQGGGICGAVSVDGAAVAGFCGGKTDWQGYNPVKYMLCAGALPENAQYSALISLSKKSAEDGGEIIRARVPVIWIRRNKAEKLLLTQ